MKTSEMIKILQQKLKEHGDLEMRFEAEASCTDEYMGSSEKVYSVCTIMDKVEGAPRGCYNEIFSEFTQNEMGEGL